MCNSLRYENKAFTEKLISKMEKEGPSKNQNDPLWFAACLDYLYKQERIGYWNGFLMFRHTNDEWHIALSCL